MLKEPRGRPWHLLRQLHSALRAVPVGLVSISRRQTRNEKNKDMNRMKEQQHKTLTSIHRSIIMIINDTNKHSIWWMTEWLCYYSKNEVMGLLQVFPVNWWVHRFFPGSSCAINHIFPWTECSSYPVCGFFYGVQFAWKGKMSLRKHVCEGNVKLRQACMLSPCCSALGFKVSVLCANTSWMMQHQVINLAFESSGA